MSSMQHPMPERDSTAEDHDMRQYQDQTQMMMADPSTSDFHIQGNYNPETPIVLGVGNRSAVNQPSDWNEYRRSQAMPTSYAMLPSPNEKTENVIEDAELSQRKRKKKYCCCFSKRGCIVCGIVTLILLLGLALTLFFAWPRYPSFQVLPVYQEPGNGLNFNQTGDPVEMIQVASTAQPFGAYSSVIVPISIQSSNYITYTFDFIKARLNILDARGNPIAPIQGTGLMSAVQIPGRTTTVIPFVSLAKAFYNQIQFNVHRNSRSW